MLYYFFRQFGKVDKKKTEYYKEFMTNVANINLSNLNNMLQYTEDKLLSNMSLSEIQHAVSISLF